MKIEILPFFDYFQEKNNDKRDKAIDDLINDFSDYCEDCKFEIQVFPRVGEYLVMEDFLRQWITATKQNNAVLGKIYRVLKSGTFKVEEVHHYLKYAVIHCSDIEYDQHN